ncbi:MAG: hypothetical protein KatS3mg005_3434 [Bryobacteraceae bacterium]|jgi:hypothetical protein|nr:MAG: hypothetical protein KatS3mg005_3434 [Bryobacteraceae bacterium]
MQKLIQVFTILPALIQAVRAAEDAVPVPKAGKEKLDLILGIIEDVVGAADDLKPVVARVVSRIVATFNALGLFRPSSV